MVPSAEQPAPDSRRTPGESATSGAGRGAPGGGGSGAASRRAGEILLAGALAAAFSPTLLAMASVWSRVDYLSHGFLVPVVSLAAVAARRDRLARRPVRPAASGRAALAGALGLLALGWGLGSVALQGLALVAAVAGFTLAVRGPHWLRELAFPVAFLLFMVPPPAAWVAPLVVQLQLVASTGAVAVLRTGGVPVLRDGNVLELAGGATLFVDEACSGITSVLTLVPLAVLLAWSTQPRGWRRAALVAAVIPLALLGNLLRVVLTVLAAREIGVEAATTGWLHEGTGLGTYVLGCLALLAVGAALRRLGPRSAAGPS